MTIEKALEIITMRNVRYITGNSKKTDGVVTAQKMLIFAENESILDKVSKLMTIKPSNAKVQKHPGKYHGWDVSKTPVAIEFTTQNRQVFQKLFKAAKKSAITASNLALQVALNAKADAKPETKAVAKTDKKVKK